MRENAKALGRRTYVLPGYHMKAQPPIESIKKAADDFNKAGKFLKENYNLTFCYHNHGYEFVPYEKGTLFDYLAANTNPDFVSFELDIVWAHLPGYDPAELIKKYPSRFRLMHVKDVRKGVKGDATGKIDTDSNVALGTGQVNVASIIKAAKKSSIQYYYIEDESNKVNEQVPVSLTYLKSL